MKKKIIAGILMGAIALSGTGCNHIAKNYGGTMTVPLQPDTKLVNVTWKNDSLWILTKPMEADDSAETYMFKEDSNFGIFEGTVYFVETKSEA